MSAPDSKQGFLANLSPWTSRASTPKPPTTPRTGEPERDKEKAKEREAAVRGTQRGGDHIVDRRNRLSSKRYPADCPPLAVRWFHAVDVPKRKPLSAHGLAPSDAALPKPKKWIPFSESDSTAIEAAFQKTADEADAAENKKLGASPTTSENDGNSPKATTTKVSVNEDYLFDVEIETRELAPAYWLGPVYDVKRGSWFTTDGEAVDESLAMQLEEGFLKVKPWRFGKPEEKRSVSQPRTRPISIGAAIVDDHRKELSRLNRDSNSNPVTPKTSFDSLRKEADKSQAELKPDDAAAMAPPAESPRIHRLFGAHMNSTVTYQDENTAWVLTDDMWSRMGSTLYQRFAGGAHFAGYKYIRGYKDIKEKKKQPSSKKEGDSIKDADRPATPSMAYGSDHGKGATTDGSGNSSDAEGTDNETRAESPTQTRRRNLERQVSSLMTSSKTDYEREQEEELRKREEKEMRDDYKNQDSRDQGRDIEHLLLITHGIGQRLGMRMESINFIHDVNTMRKSLKSVYGASPDLQALNAEVDSETKNNRIQVIPIVWRHLLDFPKQSLKHNRKEHDLGDLDHEDHEYPDLEDITVEGVPAVRNFLTDLALDILLYQSPAYKGHISRIVVNEMNRVYRLYKERNPGFKGKVSLVGHSLGSAIMFDILCIQKDAQARSSSHSSKHRRHTEEGLKLDFEVEDFYALGSPIGLFQMLKGRTISARPSKTFVSPKTPGDPLDDPFSATAAEQEHAFDITTSSPLCKQIFNIFHPTDPISYRIEPLISPAMAGLKAQPLPYTKKGIFGAPASQGLGGITSRVNQSVNDFWSSLGSGIGSALLNRSLGISGTEIANSGHPAQGQRSSRPLSVGPGSANTQPGFPELNEPASAFINEERRKRLGQETIVPGEDGEHPPTLIESEVETLFAGFQKRRKSSAASDVGSTRAEQDLEWQELEEKSRKLKKEEAKVRNLNANGRVDYSIQEGAFDISLLASIASHLAYWADEDVSHFMISQLLARHRVFKAKEKE
ncbi:DDHD domain-containing protein [Paraphoma chrysanthemicola]|uniref:DDHD domain-containing protein n=1 Tax=Paraphoma chrysanthemicola TaxID=798071 RepID=A0A8K0QWT8_9PLEO|nr:DDHD domain-containing protein [Paraphoma chrysanthemicola]